MYKFIYGFLFLIFCTNIIAQDYKKDIDSILVLRPKTYKEINNYLKKYRRDTIKLKQIIEEFHKKNYLEGKCYSENLLGIQYRYFSMFDDAIAIHKKALNTAEKANSIEFRVFALNMLGVDYRKMDANRTALDYNSEALALAEKVPNPSLGLKRSIAVSHNSMGNIYLLLKQYDLAINQFNNSQIIEKEIDNKLGLAINNQNIGNAKHAQGKIEEALKYYQTSLLINKQINNELGIAICNNRIANIYIEQNNPQKALLLIEKNLPRIEEIGSKYYLTYEYLNLGWALTKLSKLTEAEVNLLKGLALAKKHNVPSAISAAYSYLAELNVFKNNYKDAYTYYKLSKEFEEQFSNERNSQYVNDLIIKYDSERKNNQIKELAKQNEITKLKLDENRNILISSIILIFLLGIIMYIAYRERILRNDKRVLTLEQDVLRSQMNPHFIFNALNSIKQFIITNEQHNAVKYLNKFSKLMRKILESSNIKETSLSIELETMDLYMTIENMRFSNEIDFNISVDNTIDLDNIKLPPLILQPFLENALWHGLSSKEGKKVITLSIQKKNDNYIELIIEDNGIGREAAAKIKASKSFKRKSIGIDLTKERLANFVKNYNNNFSLKYQDLKINDKVLGTRVEILLPIV